MFSYKNEMLPNDKVFFCNYENTFPVTLRFDRLELFHFNIIITVYIAGATRSV